MTESGSPNFRVEIDEKPDATIVVARGELDLVGAPRLLGAVPRDGRPRIVLDLGGVGFMDSSGLRALLETRQACADAGSSFAIARPSEAVQRVLELVDLTREFEILEGPPVS